MQTSINFPIAYPSGNPLPTQSRFHNSEAKYRLLAGGFGTGKTTSLCIEIVFQLLAYPGNYGLLGRRDLQELRSTTLKELLDILPPPVIADHNRQDRVIKLKNGSELYYTNLDESREASEKIKSLNLGFAAIDQLEELQENVFLAIQGRLRRQNASRCFFATCNPAGHDWLYHKWKLSANDGYELFEATTLENIYLPKDYVAELLNYPKNWVNRFVYCSWDDFEGTVYNEFRETTHTELYQPAGGRANYVVMDYGYRNPSAILFAQTDNEGVTHIYDEFYESGKLISELAARIKENAYWREAIKLIDPSTRNAQRDGRSVYDEFSERGIWFQPANNEVHAGINRANELFKSGRLMIGKNCTNLLREIGGYKWRAIRPGMVRNEFEEPVKRDDHACFVAGTLIATDRGQIPIESIIIGDKVLCRSEYTHVTAIMKRHNADVVEAEVGGTKFTCTPDHPFYTYEDGFIWAIKVRGRHTLCVLENYEEDAQCQNQSFLTEEAIRALPGSDISDVPAKDTCTETYGNITMGRFRKGITFITRITTAQTMTFRIWKLSRAGSMYRTMRSSIARIIAKRFSQIWKESILLQKAGTLPRMVKNGIANMAEELRAVLSQPSVRVSIAGAYFFQRSQARNFAPMRAKPARGITQKPISLPTNAPCAEKHSLTISTIRQRTAQADARVKHIGQADVYNITTLAGEYFANGVLVSNCDAMRYLVNFIHTPANTTPAPPLTGRQQALAHHTQTRGKVLL